MPTKVIMPQLGESVVEGTVSKWLKSAGEPVKEFEPIMEVTTDKVDTEITAAATGILLRIDIDEGTTVTAGTVLGWIGQPGEALPAAGAAVAATHDRSPSVAEGVHIEPPAVAAVQAAAPAQAGPASKDLGFVSPVVAKIAAEHGVDLSQVKGSGAGGRITKKDVLAYVEARGSAPAAGRPAVSAPPPWEQPGEGDLFRPPELQMPATAMASPGPVSAAVPGTSMPLGSMRKSIAEHMVRSKHTSPHVTTVFEVDMSKVIAHREANKAQFARDGVNLTFTAYFVAASVAGLKAYPMVNSSFAEDEILLKKEVSIGVAVSLGEEGLIVPVIKHADEKSLLAIAREVNDLANRARNKRLKPDEVQGGTFTITNHGVSGSLFATPIINQPQCAILGVGAIQKRAVVTSGDAIAIRPMMYLALTFDHRIIDGAMADYFLAKAKETLEGWT